MSPRGEKDNKKNNNNKTQNIKKKKFGNSLLCHFQLKYPQRETQSLRSVLN